MGTEEVLRTGVEHTISTADYICKLRMDSSGVALAHQDVDNNFDVLRRSLNELIVDVDNITEGVLKDVSSASLKVNAIADDAVDTAQIANDAVDTAQIADAAVESDQIGPHMVLYEKMQNTTDTNIFLGRDSVGAGIIEEISATSSRTILNVEDGANNYVLPIAGDDVVNSGPLGGVKVDGTTVTIDGAGSIRTTTGIMKYIDLLDEDDMATDSDSKAPTQQSVKAYVDGQSTTLLDEDDMASDSDLKAPSQQSVKAFISNLLGGSAGVLLDGHLTITPPSTGGEGSQLNLTVASNDAEATSGFAQDVFKDTLDTYGHGANEWIFRLGSFPAGGAGGTVIMTADDSGVVRFASPPAGLPGTTGTRVVMQAVLRGSDGALLRNRGFTTTSRIAAGKWTVNWANAATVDSTDQYTVVLTRIHTHPLEGDTIVSSDTTYSGTVRTTTSFTIFNAADNTAFSDDEAIMIAVIV